MPVARDITGQRYGRLTAQRFVGHVRVGSQKKRLWRMLCDCGKTVDLPYSAFSSGTTRSCGCLLKERITKHGGYKSAVYKVWHAMIERCRNPNNAAWADYGGRGIQVCDRWERFAAFRDDMGPRPPKGTLERIDVDGGYTPENCRWATAKEQANNRRNNSRISFGGRTLTISQWAEETGLSKTCIIYRLGAGWPLDRCLTQPADRRIQDRVKPRRRIPEVVTRPT